jgi:DNA modification methylase
VTTTWANRITRYGEEAPDQLLAHPLNFRTHPKHQQDALSGVLTDVGVVQNIIVNERTGHVVDGHLRISLAMRQNQPTVPVTYVDLSESEEALVLATLDPISALAGADRDKLDELLRDVSTGDAAVMQMLSDLAEDAGVIGFGATEGLTDPDDVPDPPADPITQPGDLWLLGRHRLLCGDSTRAEDVARLMAGEKAAACITDPPYNVQIDYGTHKDDLTDPQYQLFSDHWSDLARRHADVLLFTPGTGRGPGMRNFLYWFLREPPHWILIWVKTNTVGHSSIGGFNAWEPIFLYGKPKKKVGQDIYDIPLTVQQDVADKRGNKLHPTPKQVSLWTAIIEDFTDAGDVILDPFVGSGTAVIAAEKSDRSCYGIELDPTYCDVIVNRWQNFTGQTATRATDAMAAD